MSKLFQDEFNTAYLPGVGFLIDPQPADYHKAIRFLQLRAAQASFRTSQHSLLDRLEATARRLEWTPARLRERQERAAA